MPSRVHRGEAQRREAQRREAEQREAERRDAERREAEQRREGLISAAHAMSDSMGEAVWRAAMNGDEAELTRLIGLGGNVNWHNSYVRRRMCLAWAPASSPLLLLRSPSPPR